MRPLVVLLGIVMGSTVSIAAALLLTGVVFLLLPEYGSAAGGRANPPLIVPACYRCYSQGLPRRVSTASCVCAPGDRCGSRSAAGDAGSCPVDLLAEIDEAHLHEYIRVHAPDTWFLRCLRDSSIDGCPRPRSRRSIDEGVYRAHIADSRPTSSRAASREPRGKAHARTTSRPNFAS